MHETPAPVTLRLDPEIRRRVKAFADQPPRQSLNAAVNQLLAEALDAHDRKENEK